MSTNRSTPSLTVRRSAAGELTHRRSDSYSSRWAVVVDFLWNLTFVAVASAMLIVSKEEQQLLPVRLWVVRNAVQCIVHMASVCFELRRRRTEGSSRDSVSLPRLSVSKQVDHAMHMFTLIWWIIGYYWMSSGGSETHDSPKLYWLSIVFLVSDLLFVAFCAAVAIVVGFALCCCLPCFIAIMYVAAEKDGATEEDIRQLPKYKFRTIGASERPDGEICPWIGIMTECGRDAPLEHKLAAKDAKCCICLCDYEDGEELRQLPCNHHFHRECVDKWLYINATCPLCKHNIVKVSNGESKEVSHV